MAKKIGNDRADANADIGTKLHHKVLREASLWLDLKHKAYTNLMKNIIIHIVEAYLIHKQLGEIQQEDKQEVDKYMFYQALQYPENKNANEIEFDCTIGHFAKALKGNLCILLAYTRYTSQAMLSLSYCCQPFEP